MCVAAPAVFCVFVSKHSAVLCSRISSVLRVKAQPCAVLQHQLCVLCVKAYSLVLCYSISPVGNYTAIKAHEGKGQGFICTGAVKEQLGKEARPCVYTPNRMGPGKVGA
eukprot:1158495-Pelagomonas_calceolata.AAC.12